MSDVILKPRDLEIKRVRSERYGDSEVVQIIPAVAFNDSFIKEMREAGVKDARKKSEDEEVIEDEYSSDN